MMNPSDKIPATEPSDWRHQLDLLVDGELDPGQRRALLRELEAAPEGWRQCAMAFLEAQAWREDLRDLLYEPSLGPVPPCGPRPSPTEESRAARGSNRLGRHVATLLTMAASFLAALWLGSWLQQMRHVPVDRGGESAQLADVAGESRGPLPAQPPQNALAEQPAVVPRPSDRPAEDWQMVTFAAGEGPHRESICLPAVQRERLDPQWLEQLPRAIPREMLEALRRTGYEIRQRRELVPMRLDDGRQLVVPVEEVDVHYVGGPPL